MSVRTVVEGRTARATTNRVDEDSLRAAIESSLSLAASQPKNPTLLAMPGRQKYRRVNRFIKQTAAITPGDRAQAVRRACDLAIKNGQVAAGIFSTGQSQIGGGQFARSFCGVPGNARGIFHHHAGKAGRQLGQG